MKRIVVLGVGMVGSAIAADLCREYRVTAVDASRERVEASAAEHPLTGEVADLSCAEIVHSVVRDADLVIGAVPGFMGFATLQAIIEAGKNVVDISFFGEDPFVLDALALANSVTAVDRGVAPGLSNMVLGYHAARMSVEAFRCLVGGLPAVRTWPWQYKAPFSPIDVLEEYTRPARVVEHGVIVTRPWRFRSRSWWRSRRSARWRRFNTDGLRSMLITMSQVPNMAEKTLRYPGHIDLVRALAREWIPEPGADHRGRQPGAADRPDRGVTLSAVAVGARRAGVHRDGDQRARERGRGAAEHIYRLLDRTDERTGTSSMARTTGLYLHGRGSSGAGRSVHPGRHLSARVRGRGRDLLRARAGRSGGARCAGRAGRALNLSCVGRG